MSDARTIRENAKKELGIWMENSIKKEVADVYKLARAQGIRALDAIAWARMVVEFRINRFIEGNFHSHIPKQRRST